MGYACIWRKPGPPLAFGLGPTPPGPGYQKWYEPTDKQDRFHFCPARNVLYGGAAGGGKSHALRHDLYIRSLAVPQYRSLLLRRTYPELQNTHIQRAELEGHQLGAQYKQVTKTLYFANDSTIEFGHCETEQDIGRYLSTEYDCIAFDELVTFSERQFKFISSRARSTKPGITPMIRAGTNPGGVQSYWVKRYFIDKTVTPEEDPVYDPEEWIYVPARLYDNPHIDDSYENRLKALPSEALRRAYLDGDWNTFEGQFFSEWAAEKDGKPWHVIPTLPEINGKPLDQHPHIEMFRALDWGYRAPGVCLWFACLPDGRLVVTQEYVFKETLPTEVARTILERSKGMKIRYTVADPSLWLREGSTGEGIAESFVKAKCPLNEAENERMNGWARVHAWLTETTGHPPVPMLQVHQSCKYLIRTLPSQIFDEKRQEDIQWRDAEDHAADALRYGLMSRPSPSKLPVVKNTSMQFSISADGRALLRAARRPRKAWASL